MITKNRMLSIIIPRISPIWPGGLKLLILLLTEYVLIHYLKKGTVFNKKVYTCRDFIVQKECSIRKKAGQPRKIIVPNGALAAWDFVELRCRKLKQTFVAALCRNSGCNIGNYQITKPKSIKLVSKPIFANRKIAGMKERKTVLVPIACSCQVRVF